MESVERLRYLLIRPKGFKILTDHKNLLFTYDPLSVKRLNVRARIDRWILKLRGYRYEVIHIAGVENLWSDLLSRWGASNISDSTYKLCRVTRTRNIPRHVANPVITPFMELDFPSLDDFKRYQEHSTELPNCITKNTEGLFTNSEGKVWVPEQARTAVLTIAHYGISGHNGTKSTLQRLKEKVFWDGMTEDVTIFVLDCILCRCAKMVLPTRRHLGIQQRPTKPNQSIHFDYFYVGESLEDLEYLMVIRDGFSRFVMIFPVEKADAETAVYCLLEWIGLFGIPRRFFSDNGPHFRNITMKQLARRLGTVHDFSTVYCAWANGLIERVLRDIKALLKIMFIEMKVDKRNWPKLKGNLLMALNHRPSESLAGLTPVEVHTGIPATNSLDFYLEDRERFRDIPWTPNMVDHLAALSDQLDFVHDEVYKATKRITENARKESQPLPEFEIGDYVLYCFVERKSQKQSKLHFTWLGPFQIVDSKSDYVFYIKDLVSQGILEAHIDRLSFYSTQQLNVTGDLLDLISREGIDYEISEFVDILWDEEAKTHVVKTLWSGFAETEATYEPFRSLLDQIPLFLLKFLNSFFLRGNKQKIEGLLRKEKTFIIKVIKRNKLDMKSFDFMN